MNNLHILINIIWLENFPSLELSLDRNESKDWVQQKIREREGAKSRLSESVPLLDVPLLHRSNSQTLPATVWIISSVAWKKKKMFICFHLCYQMFILELNIFFPKLNSWLNKHLIIIRNNKFHFYIIFNIYLFANRV